MMWSHEITWVNYECVFAKTNMFYWVDLWNVVKLNQICQNKEINSWFYPYPPLHEESNIRTEYFDRKVNTRKKFQMHHSYFIRMLYRWTPSLKGYWYTGSIRVSTVVIVIQDGRGLMHSQSNTWCFLKSFLH